MPSYGFALGVEKEIVKDWCPGSAHRPKERFDMRVFFGRRAAAADPVDFLLTLSGVSVQEKGSAGFEGTDGTHDDDAELATNLN